MKDAHSGPTYACQLYALSLPTCWVFPVVAQTAILAGFDISDAFCFNVLVHSCLIFTPLGPDHCWCTFGNALTYHCACVSTLMEHRSLSHLAPSSPVAHVGPPSTPATQPMQVTTDAHRSGARTQKEENLVQLEQSIISSLWHAANALEPPCGNPDSQTAMVFAGCPDTRRSSMPSRTVPLGAGARNALRAQHEDSRTPSNTKEATISTTSHFCVSQQTALPGGFRSSPCLGHDLQSGSFLSIVTNAGATDLVRACMSVPQPQELSSTPYQSLLDGQTLRRPHLC